ncbi:MAG TPA: DUF2092 domain-containing protein [Pirellulales bacterium]|nr:DUF2092 domain-containing protein [Pirellulales bacterium]
MNARENDDRTLDELLTGYYAPLREVSVDEREQVIERVAAARADVVPAGLTIRRRPLALLATAACLLVAISLAAILISPTAEHAYGLEALPERFFAVQSIRIRGTDYIYDNHKPEAPAVKVPTEFLVKRPNKYRHTSVGVGQSKNGVEIRRAMVYCDGRRQTLAQTDDKEYFTVPIGALEAQLKTEASVQAQIASEFLKPSTADYKKLRTETYAGRQCDVYENRIRDEDIERTTIETIWLDPTTGLPVHLVLDEVLDDGTTRRDSEYDEISVNIPLDDSLFEFTPPADYKSLVPAIDGEAGADATVEPPLDVTPRTSGAGFDSHYGMWHSFRLSDRSALVIWSRSQPEPAEGPVDWLSNIEFTVGKDRPAPRHAWIYQAGEADKWNWSLISAADGPFSDRLDAISFKMRGPRFEGNDYAFPLRFADADLEKILAAAAAGMLPADAPHHSLAALRALAREQLKDPPAAR